MVENRIDYIKFPESHEARFNEIMDIIATSIKTGGLPHSGVIDLGVLPKEGELPYFFLMWISETNEVIENLNLVLSDLDLLKTGYFLFRGSPRVRYTLLIRTLLGEIYRIREIFNRAISELSKLGYIPKKDVKPIRDYFMTVFGVLINLRGNLVHGMLIWKGQRIMDLVAWDCQNELNIHEKQGWDLSIQETLKQLCEQSTGVMVNEGKRMVEGVQLVIDYWVKKIL